MKLEKIALHHVKKEEQGKPSLNLSDHLLPVNELTKEFIITLIKSYSSRSPTYGAFNEDSANNPFQTYITTYFEDDDFLSFSKKSMKTLEKAIDIPKAKGGYVVFAHYNENDQDFILTIMLDNSVKFIVDDSTLDIKKLLALDIEKVARANRVNRQRWTDNKENYLSFIKGTREVSSYFSKSFIGCTDLTSAKQNANHLQDAVTKYMKINEFTEDQKINARRKLKDYTDRQISEDKDIKLNSISALLNTDNPTDFIDYIGDNGLEVSGSFRSTRPSDFKGFEIKTVKGNGYKLEYQMGADNVELDKISHKIIISNLPDSVFDD